MPVEKGVIYVIYLYMITGILVLISFLFSREKTIKAIKSAFLKMKKIFPAIAVMMVFVSILLFLIPEKMIIQYLGTNGRFSGVILASLVGSITLIPGFIAYPLCAILLKKGVTYMVLSAFTTTLMMVGIVTFPVEKAYFGTKVTIVRNGISFMIAICVAVATGIVFGELF